MLKHEEKGKPERERRERR